MDEGSAELHTPCDRGFRVLGRHTRVEPRAIPYAALVAAGNRAVVASAGGPLLHGVTRAGAKHVTLPAGSTNPLTLFANVKRLTEVIRAEKVDIVHARSHGTAASAWWAARRSGRSAI